MAVPIIDHLKVINVNDEQGQSLPLFPVRQHVFNLLTGGCLIVHAPSTFSGGEQQRVNIARGFAVDYPILLLDEPTASLDGKNSAAVVNLIHDAKARGAAIVGIFHDEGVRRQVADRLHSMGMTA